MSEFGECRKAAGSETKKIQEFSHLVLALHVRLAPVNVGEPTEHKGRNSMKSELHENDLECNAQRGKSQAAETLFRRYHRALFRPALRVLGNTEMQAS